jgi:hypothetical protein
LEFIVKEWITTRKTETSIGQRLTEVSPKLMKINFFIGFELISIGIWPTEVYRRKLANFCRLYLADESYCEISNFH